MADNKNWLQMIYRVVGVSRLNAELSQDPDAIGQLEGLVQHVLAFYVSLGNGVDVVILQLPRHCVYNTRIKVTSGDENNSIGATIYLLSKHKKHTRGFSHYRC